MTDLEGRSSGSTQETRGVPDGLAVGAHKVDRPAPGPRPASHPGGDAAQEAAEAAIEGQEVLEA
jgi:hypothetical protein